MSNDFNNPYRPPSAYVADAQTVGEDNFLGEPRAVPAGNATAWLGAGWDMFKQQAGLWVLMALVYGILYIIISFIPFVSMLLSLVVPVMTGGFMYACDRQRQDGTIEFGYMFAGFQQKTGQLMLIGLFQLAIVIVCAIILFIFMGASVGMAMLSGNDSALASGITAGSAIGMLVGGFLVFLVVLLYGAAAWLAPALIMLHDLSAIEALKLGFSAFKKNILSAILCSILLTILMFLSALPLFLGLLVTVPMMYCAIYATYRDLFFEDEY